MGVFSEYSRIFLSAVRKILTKISCSAIITARRYLRREKI
jgi:hypothetical protein